MATTVVCVIARRWTVVTTPVIYDSVFILLLDWVYPLVLVFLLHAISVRDMYVGCILLDLHFRPFYYCVPALDLCSDFPTSAGDFICNVCVSASAAVLVLAF